MLIRKKMISNESKHNINDKQQKKAAKATATLFPRALWKVYEMNINKTKQKKINIC